MHREVKRYWPASFPQRKLNGDESSRLEKAFWETIFRSEFELAVYEFLKTYFRVVTNLNDYVTDDDDYDIGFRFHYIDKMILQFKQDLYNKIFSHQDQDKRDDGPQKGIQLWRNYVVVKDGASIPEHVFEFIYSEPEADFLLSRIKV